MFAWIKKRKRVAKQVTTKENIPVHTSESKELLLSSYATLPRTGKMFPKKTSIPRYPSSKAGTKILTAQETQILFEKAEQYERSKVPMHDVFSIEGLQTEPFIRVTRHSNMRRGDRDGKTTYDFGCDKHTLSHFVYEEEFDGLLGDAKWPYIYCKEEDVPDAIDSIKESLVSRWESQIKLRRNKIETLQKALR